MGINEITKEVAVEECKHGIPINKVCWACTHPGKEAASNSPSVGGYTKEDMINFANWVYGPEIDCINVSDQYKCRTTEGALEYWLEKVKPRR